MILLALDASTTAVGFAFFGDGDLLESGVYVPPKKAEWVERVESIGDWLSVTLSRSPIGAVAYELATGNKGNMRTNRLLGAVEYEARRKVSAYGVPFYEVTASQVQRRDYPNKNNLELARQIKGAPLHPKLAGDEADAIGVGLVAWGKIKMERWTR